MKKNITIAALLFVLSVFSLVAQDNKSVSPTVVGNFEKAFAGASRVRFEPFKNVYRVKFFYNGNSWLAYYQKDGLLISKGRLIKSLDNLPIMVQSGILSAKSKTESKFGVAVIANIYEMMDGTFTEYYLTLENNSVNAVYSISPHGTVTMKSKQKKEAVLPSPVDAIAKKN